MTMLTHPEQQKNETYLGNTTVTNGKIKPHLNPLTTARIGNIAYTHDGKKIKNRDDLKPLFINRSESSMYDDIMMNKF
jgi:hypothetical protein